MKKLLYDDINGPLPFAGISVTLVAVLAIFIAIGLDHVLLYWTGAVIWTAPALLLIWYAVYIARQRIVAVRKP